MQGGIQRIFSSRLCVEAAVRLARGLSPAAGYRLGATVASAVARLRGTGLIRAMRTNLWIASGGASVGPALDGLVRSVLTNSAQALCDFYRYLEQSDGDGAPVRFDDPGEALLARMRDAREGTVVVTGHLSNFDLAALAVARRGIGMTVLTTNGTAGGYRLQNRLRNTLGIRPEPVSLRSMREAARTLERGGTVVTGVDRPTPGSGQRPAFFGRPAALPAHHVHLALRARVPVVAIGVHRDEAGLYHVTATDPIRLEPGADRHATIRNNMQRVLQPIEAFIRRRPEQWSMFFPVWPDAEPECRAAERAAGYGGR